MILLARWLDGFQYMTQCMVRFICIFSCTCLSYCIQDCEKLPPSYNDTCAAVVMYSSAHIIYLLLCPLMFPRFIETLEFSEHWNVSCPKRSMH
jgi:hypothetical protein